MFKWFSKFLNPPYVEAVKDVEEFIKDLKISEPVYAIVKTFDEKGRWRVKSNFDPWVSPSYYKRLYSFTVTDNTTEEEYNLYSDGFYYTDVFGLFSRTMFPYGVSKHYMPTWMTEAEKDYVVSEIEEWGKVWNERFKRIEDRKHKKSEAKAKVNQDKERQRLMKLYCKED